MKRFEKKIREIILPAIFLFPSSAAWAVQQHGEPEGLIAHQLGHLLFIAGLLFLTTRMKWKEIAKKGWGWFKCFFIFIISWNILTFFSHLQDVLVKGENFIRANNRTSAFIVHDSLDLLYYLSKFDHILLVPGFICLAMALRAWGQEP